jgi:selenocysteine-specific elongation factor
VEAAGLEGPDWAGLAAAEPALLQLLLEAGAVQKVGDHALSRPALDGLAAAVRGWFGAHDTLTPADFKELTGLSRRHAIPLLEWLDAQRITLRDGDLRRLRPPDAPRV